MTGNGREKQLEKLLEDQKLVRDISARMVRLAREIESRRDAALARGERDLAEVAGWALEELRLGAQSVKEAMADVEIYLERHER